MKKKNEYVKKFIGIHFKVGACNLKCSYCYLGKHENHYVDIPYSVDEIRRAFSKRRLGGVCFINICSDGETLIHPLMPQIIKEFLEEGHYVLVVTNATLRQRIEECINCGADISRLFFKVSFHYEEMQRLGLLDIFWDNLDLIKSSACSFTVEYITSDETLEQIEEFKQICMEKMHAYPHINMPRNEQASNLGVLSKNTWRNYIQKWDIVGFESEFWKFRKQVFGKKYNEFCYAGERSLWINMENGFSYQCYDLPPIQNFMGEIEKPVKWLAIGNNCPQAHCYVAYSHMTLGTINYQGCVKYKPHYDEIRNRICTDGSEWIKPIYKRAFQVGVTQIEFSARKKKIVNILNKLLRWNARMKKV